MRSELGSTSPLLGRIADLRRQLAEAESDLVGTSVQPAGFAGEGPYLWATDRLVDLAFEQCPFGLAVLDGQGRWLHFNQALCDALGEDRAGLAATSLLDLAWPEDRDALRADLARPTAGPDCIDYRFRNRRGNTTWGRLHLAAPVHAEVAGGVQVCLFEDVTIRRLVAAGGGRDRQDLFDLIAQAPIPVALFDASMFCLAHSDLWPKMHEVAGVPVVGRNHYEVVPDIPERWKEVHRRCLGGEVLSSEEDRLDQGDGRASYYRWAAHPWRTQDGQVAGLILSADRIDDLVHARQGALEASRLKAEFLANMSHEIRTPMNGVLGMVELLLETALSAEQRDLATTIFDSGQALLTLIDDILDFSRIESGQSAIHPREFNLAAVLAEIAEIMVLPAQSKGIELLYDFPTDLAEQYEGDSGRIRQILLNLVGNAIKFTHQGEVWIMARALPDDAPPGPDGRQPNIRLSVQDTGIGIEEGRRLAIFESFTQGDGSSSRPHGGAGLGLSICHRLARLLGGSIGLVTTPGLGSTFHLDLPLVRCEPPPGEATGRPLLGRTIVVADRSASARSLIRAQLERWGAEVVEAETAAATLVALGSVATPDRSPVLLISEQLVEDDPQFFRTINARPEQAAVPVVFMTTGPTRGRTTDRGCCQTIAKPIRPVCLLQALTAGPASAGCVALVVEPVLSIDSGLVGTRVLLAEDNPTNQKVAAKMLKRLGCTFEVVNDGTEALARFDQACFDLILMDVQMPRMDGYQATGAIRRIEAGRPNPGRVPIIAMTAHAMQGDRERCLAAEMDDYLSKPVTISRLAEMLRRWASPPRTTPPAVAPAPVPATLPVLRIARLHELSLGEIDFERDLLECLLSDVATGVDRLRAALDPLDPRLVANTLHGIVGACRTVGADDLAAHCRDRESEAWEPGFRPGAGWLASIEQKQADLIAAIATRLGG